MRRGQKIRVSHCCCSALQNVAEAPEEGIAKIFTLEIMLQSTRNGLTGNCMTPTKEVRPS
jgi:hypothetical protein